MSIYTTIQKKAVGVEDFTDFTDFTSGLNSNQAKYIKFISSLFITLEENLQTSLPANSRVNLGG